MKQITIFGASGFIGHHLVRRLAKTGAIIRVPTRDIEKAMTLKPMGSVGQIVPMLCNPYHDGAVATAIGKSDAVINLIGVLYEKGLQKFQTAHVEMAARISRIAKEQGATNFVQMSALGARANASARYALTKFKGEDAVHNFFPDAVILRPSLVFGPEDDFFNRFAKMARISPMLPLIGGGATKFQPVYVGDVAEAIVCALEFPQAAGKVFELGGPQVYTFRQLLELTLRVIRRERNFINLPFSLASLQASLMQLAPKPPLTRDQVVSLKSDNVVQASSLGLSDLGITPTALEIILPTYLDRFRPASNAHSTSAVKFMH